MWPAGGLPNDIGCTTSRIGRRHKESEGRRAAHGSGSTAAAGKNAPVPVRKLVRAVKAWIQTTDSFTTDGTKAPVPVRSRFATLGTTSVKLTATMYTKNR